MITKEELRYERKFLTVDHSPKEIEQIIKFNSACFSEIYYERKINNIYFDSLGFDSYFDNIEGETERMKLRIRWYNQMFGNIEAPTLEYKIKKGLLGIKKSFPMNSFVLENYFDREIINNAMGNPAIPLHVQTDVRSLVPVLLSGYKRKYFLSADKRFRLTIDHNLHYYKIHYGNNTFLNKSVDNNSSVVELKYNASDESEANVISSQFPFPLTKSSKYVQGIERTSN